MPDKLYELDPTSFTTGARNWLQKKRDQALGAAGNGRAFGRHTTRLVTNKLYKAWKRYLGMQGKQGTNVELAHFVNQFFGPQRLNSLSQKFPQVVPAADPQQQQQQPAQQAQQQPPAPQATAPAATPAQPQPAAAPVVPATQATPDDTESYRRFQNYTASILQKFRAPATPHQSSDVMTALNNMLSDFANRSEKAKSWVRGWINNNLSGYSSLIPELANYLGGNDPFSAAQGATPAQTEARRIKGRLVEADPSLDIPQPGGTPPDFMQSAQNPPEPPSSPQAVVLNRKTTDTILVTLARLLIDSGDAGRNGASGAPPAAPGRANAGNTAQPPVSPRTRHDAMHTKITTAVLNQAIRTSGNKITDHDYRLISQIIRKNGGTATMGQIMSELGKTISQSTVQTLMYAGQYAH